MPPRLARAGRAARAVWPLYSAPSMELALWRWSVAVQLTSVAMITLFFGVLQASVRREDLRFWSRGWMLNLSALSVALFFWVVQPAPGPIYWWVRLLFLSLKTLAALFMMQGAWALGHPGGQLIRRPHLVIGALLYPFVGAFLLYDNDRIGVVQQTGYGVLFLLTA